MMGSEEEKKKEKKKKKKRDQKEGKEAHATTLMKSLQGWGLGVCALRRLAPDRHTFTQLALFLSLPYPIPQTPSLLLMYLAAFGLGILARLGCHVPVCPR
jgi:hypothetical protein